MKKIFILVAGIVLASLAGCHSKRQTVAVNKQEKLTDFAGEEGQFEWQFPNKDKQKAWERYSYSPERWWGTFPRDLKASADMFKEYPWAIGPFTKHKSNPVLAPTSGAWDQGRHDGGVHNGAVIVKDDIFYYIYRGERPIDVKQNTAIDYICDIGVATSKDGVNFTKDTSHSPFFRTGEDKKYSYEDVNIVKHGDTYYLFCNQWYWPETSDYKVNGTFLATSKDLLNWKKVGIVFPGAKRTHRNAVVLQNKHNVATKVNGKFVMYINDGLMAYSDDMINWESKEIKDTWPGGEGCFALSDFDSADPDKIVLFTGGNHTGNFYAAGQVLFSKKDAEKPLQYLPRPFLAAETSIPWENGFSVEDKKKSVSSFSDCIFFNGLTFHKGKWWLYYGGSEYYTCLATATELK